MAEPPKEKLFTGKGKGMTDIYCYGMKGSTLLLADERNKKHLLDLLLCAHRACSCPVYAFCITDDAAYVITEADDTYTLQMLQEQAIRRFWEMYEGFPDPEGMRYLHMQRIEPIQSMPEFARRCRAIHRLPLSLGYVRRIGDYWWSSYQNYQQGYRWGMVDCSVLLQFFSSDPEDAFHRLRLHHGIRRIRKRHSQDRPMNDTVYDNEVQAEA